jgi:hypothetical protein
MSLLAIRKWLVQESGRMDIVTDPTTYADNGANQYINSGQMILDDWLNLSNSPADNFQGINQGEDSIQFQFCRAIKAVYCIDTTNNSKWRLYKGIPRLYSGEDYGFWPDDYWCPYVTVESMGQPLGAAQWPPTEQGPPRFYRPINFRMTPENIQGNVPANLLRYVSGTSYLIYGLWISPIADNNYVIQTHGLFYSQPLVNDTDCTFWTEQYPHLLVLASMMVMEMFFRNTQGVSDLRSFIDMQLVNMDKNLVMQQISDIHKMKG